jgi:CBS domain-containing protein
MVGNGLRASDRFLAAFSQLERLIKRMGGSGGKGGFSTNLDRAKKNNALVRRHAVDLSELADLRNAIVHERTDGHPIAEPHESTVLELERLVGLLESPPKVESLLPIQLRSCHPSERIGAAARVMSQKAFSQLPVVENGRFVGLLTAEAIAFWLADAFSGDLGLLGEVSVERVLPFKPPESTHRFLGRHDLLEEVITSFEHEQAEGRYLQAALITHSGKPDETVLGILTSADLPNLYRRSGILRT